MGKRFNLRKTLARAGVVIEYLNSLGAKERLSLFKSIKPEYARFFIDILYNVIRGVLIVNKKLLKKVITLYGSSILRVLKKRVSLKERIKRLTSDAGLLSYTFKLVVKAVRLLSP